MKKKTKKSKKNTNKIINEIVIKILLYSYGENTNNLKCFLFNKILYLYKKKEKLNFVIPAFPGKSPNKNSCFSHLPDYTESIAINTLKKFICDIEDIYPYGCRLTIIHDGHFFYYLNITREEKELNEYINTLRECLNKKILSKTIYDLTSEKDLKNAYLTFEKKYLKSQSNYNSDLSKEILFTKNEFSDRIYTAKLSNTQKQKIAKKIAISSFKIKSGINEMINDLFPEYIRLSVHYQDINSMKIGIKLIPNSVNKGTPWFYVAYITKQQEIILGKKDWDFKDKILCFSKNGIYYSINEDNVKLFLQKKTNKKILKESELNR